MELQFEKSVIPCLGRLVNEVQNLEQTQEIKLSDAFPDIGRVLCAWGQVILRGKEWRSDSFQFSGGMMVWVLYAPEDGTAARSIDTWIPFQMKWDLPDTPRDGTIRIACRPRFVDARSVSPRKIMVRAGVSALGEAYAPYETETAFPGEIPEGVELLRQEYPVRLPREAGEKTFLLEEELTMPQSAPQPERLVYYTAQPEITDMKVLGNKLAFRGNGNLHVLYASEDGEITGQDFLLPFSQFSELDGSYGSDARASVTPCVTNLELEMDEEGQLHMKCGLVGQYLVDDVSAIQTVADAYSPGRELNVQSEELKLPILLDSRRENIYGEQMIPGEASRVVDVSFLTGFPHQRRIADDVQLEVPGNMQLLYYGNDDSLQSASGRWEGQMNWNADEEASLTVQPLPSPEPQISLNGDHISARMEVPLELSAYSDGGIRSVTGLEIGDRQEPDSTRPSLILRRATEASLWDIAKESGSTVAAIRRANGLDADPVPGQMLLIPVS